MSIRTKLTNLLLILFAVALLNAAFSFWMEQISEEFLGKVNQTHSTILLAEQLLSALKDAETGQRGYLLTSQPDYLEPYYSGTERARLLTQQLNETLVSDPVQQTRLSVVSEDIDKKFAELDETITLFRAGQTSQAMAVVASNEGKKIMDRIRTHLNAFTRHERNRLTENRLALQVNQSRIVVLVAVEVFILIGLAISTLVFLQSSLFAPLNRLMSHANRVKSGERMQTVDLAKNDEIGRLMISFYEMSEQVHQRTQALDDKAKLDELTGLNNRVTLRDRLAQAIEIHKTKNANFAVLYLDLNDFKVINDDHGHQAGDKVLQLTAQRLKAIVREGDAIFRMGGDEFLIIVNFVASDADADHIASKIEQEFQQPMDVDGRLLTIHLSIGCALYPQDSEFEEELIVYSDLAMYAAKRSTEVNRQRFETRFLRRASDQ